MKLSVRCLILVISMIVLTIAMYQFSMKVAIPYLMNSDWFVLVSGLIFGVVAVLVIWTGSCEFLMKRLKCTELVDKFINASKK